jgi:putative tricarboxylic transport membrane protein
MDDPPFGHDRHLRGNLTRRSSIIASWLAYTTETKFSKHPELMGTGDPHGIAASRRRTTPQPAALWYRCSPWVFRAATRRHDDGGIGYPGRPDGPAALKGSAGVFGSHFHFHGPGEYRNGICIAVRRKILLQVSHGALLDTRVFIMVLTFTGCYVSRNSMTPIYIMLIGSIFGFFEQIRL